jgi:regulator of sigma E protease
MDYIVIIAQLILSLSILVVLHELGHFIPARLFNTRVEKFYLFFDPWFSLFKVKKGDTEYGVGWLPLGGYVKISGMVDESFDKEQLKQAPQPWEFRSKPAWQRLIIMLGGVIVNFILGFFIFSMLLWGYGEEYLPAENAVYGIHVDSMGQEMGLRTGDKILKLGEKPFEKFNQGEFIREIALNDARSVTVLRDGKEKIVLVDSRFTDELTRASNKNKRLFEARVPFVAAQFTPDSPAEQAGMKSEDRIIGLDGEDVTFFDEFAGQIKGKESTSILVTVLRNETDTVQLRITTDDDAKMGVYPMPPVYFFETAKTDYSLFTAIPAGVNKGWTFITDQIKAFGKMFSGEIKASESLGGFGTIGSLFPTTWQWESFWRITAILSLILGFMNLLPIPALDGGHVVFLLWEVVTGRKVSDKVMETATMIGFILLLGLIIYVNGLDVFRFFNR